MDPSPARIARLNAFGAARNSRVVEAGVPETEGSGKVRVEEGWIDFPTYEPARPDRNPMFLEKRVYQGSCGKVYPLPVIDRIAEKPTPRRWKAVWLENEYLRVLILPEIGGRIHALIDKSTGYDLIYRQSVIKPALVGLAGPWLSGGIEFNWPQHHRPATFMPTDVAVEREPDGSVTVWCGDHDPMARMKGMHGVCLHPGRACLELRVRVHNRTPHVQTFLWWANVATRVHEAYQSFFPPDVRYVADHARRSMSRYPRCDGRYYGVDYARRGGDGVPADEVPRQFIPPHCDGPAGTQRVVPGLPHYSPDDLSYYANIPVPTSYMCVGSRGDFFGGYDYRAQAGIVHVANRHISPGKKQWTWGNQEFGYAWDRNLTDAGASGDFAPYIEIMAGVYTDNQPDFSFLQPGETRKWSQYWYPIHRIGPVHQANKEAAVHLAWVDGMPSLKPREGRGSRTLRVGVSVVSVHRSAQVRLHVGRRVHRWSVDLAPGKPFVTEVPLRPGGIKLEDCRVQVCDTLGKEIIAYRHASSAPRDLIPPAATEPQAPRDVATVDELYQIGRHLAQYRHATRCPTEYWREGLRRDSGEARCNTAMGEWHLRRGEFAESERLFRCAIERLTRWNANPYDGEAFYQLGLCLRFQGRDDEAYAALYKATWNQAWQAISYQALAELDCGRGDWITARDHLERALRLDADNLKVRNLLVLVLRQLGQGERALLRATETLALDPLDVWAQWLAGGTVVGDLQTRLDVAHDLARAGFLNEAIQWLTMESPRKGRSSPARSAVETMDARDLGAQPMVDYTLGWLHEKRGDAKAAKAARRRAAAALPDHCFPARLEDIAVLESAMRAQPDDARAPYYLGNLLYDRRRHEEALRLWERSARRDAGFATVWRNLGIGEFNVRRRPEKARLCYQRACRADPSDARLLYERDQLWKRLGFDPGRRLRVLEAYRDRVAQRDDLSLELCALYNQTGRSRLAEPILTSRRFQPWEGGEGMALGQYARTQRCLGFEALARGDVSEAQGRFELALEAPENLGEARHLLANQSHTHAALGLALEQLRSCDRARQHWTLAAQFEGDFQGMRVQEFSEMTFYSAFAWGRLGDPAKQRALLNQLLAYSRRWAKAPATVDYFATSLPTMLLFDDDLQARRETSAMLMEAQALCGLGQVRLGLTRLAEVLRRNPNHGGAQEFQQQQQFFL